VTSAIHYLILFVKKYEKGDYFSTETARQIAKNRVKIMKSFINNFMEEWFLAKTKPDVGKKK
jgi:hypothetical protein